MRRALLALSLALLSSGPLWAQDAITSQPAETYTLSSPELTQLLTISARLKALSVSLSDKLTTSQALLKTQESELKALRLELVGLESTIVRSSTRSAMLRETLLESEQALTDLSSSFDEYKNEAQKTIKTWRLIAIGSIVAGAAIAIIF
jgi:DNA repair exonuclease SbcCD ATPase subunit